MPEVADLFPGSRRGSDGELPLHEDPASNDRFNPKSESRKFTFKRLIKSYWSDWVLIFALWGLLAVLNRSGGHKREFSLRDISIQHTFAERERVPSFLLAVVSFGIPCAIELIIALFVSRNAWDVHNSICGLGMAWTMTGVITQIIKMMVGRPRPDLIARCLPREGAKDHPVFGLSTIDICTSTNMQRLNDGFKSFPSGHSSLAFAGCGFLSFYLAGKMHLWDAYGHRNRAWFALSPLLLGAMVAISRTMDNRHHWQDVLVGSTLGFVIAFIAYRTYYPGLKHRSCHLPLLPRPSSSEISDEAEYDPDIASASAVRLLPDDSGIPRESEDDWRAASPRQSPRQSQDWRSNTNRS